jgi:UDP-2,3-diacylglucosamine pyrophosphatase LpxH
MTFKVITLAVQSDLHIGPSARAKDLRTSDETGAIDTDYKKQFLQFIQSNRIIADYLIVPGDISDSAQPDEFILASEIICETSKALKLISMDRIIFVPGNHDVDWTMISNYPGDKSGVRRQQRYSSLRESDCLFKQIIESGHENFFIEPFYSLWEFGDLLVIAYNSSWHDDPNIAIHYGLIAEESINQLKEALVKIDLSPRRLRLFIVHHHPIQYSDPLPNEPDFSAMTNSPNLLKLLRDNNFDLVIHGHKHKPDLRTLSIDSGFPLVILGAGSFSAIIDSRWSGLVNNLFHVIKISGRDEDTGCIFGETRSWAYLCGRGWVPSGLHNGIIHNRPFGTYIQPSVLVNKLNPIIYEHLQHKDYLEWLEIVKELPYLQHLPPDRVIEVLDKLSSQIDFRRHGEFPDEIVLLKGGG